jgi:hypothetical protein
MLLILSNENDPVSQDIMNCLFYRAGINCIILNEFSKNSPKHLKIELNNNLGWRIEVDQTVISYIFIRKFPTVKLPVSKSHQLATFYKSEFDALISFFDLLGLHGKIGLGSTSYNPNDVNKLYALKTALDVGLLIPQTSIVNNKVDYIQFIQKEGPSCITKPIQNIAAYYNKRSKSVLKMLTARVDGKEIVGDIFFPTLLQNEIKKKFELRVFFICGDIYSVAIFSQLNTKTKLDFRNYDELNPNRISIYNLPGQIKDKITALMNLLNLSTGSIDMIFSESNEYIFLEVNPYGLFGQFTNVGIDIAKIISKHIKMKIDDKEKRETINSFKNGSF